MLCASNPNPRINSDVPRHFLSNFNLPISVVHFKSNFNYFARRLCAMSLGFYKNSIKYGMGFYI